MVENVSIDNLTIVADDSGRFASLANDPLFSFIERWSPASFPYDKSFYCEDGSIIQYTKREETRALRYEFNPNKIETEDQQKNVERILGTMKYPEVSRVDVAFDIKGVDISQYYVLDLVGRKSNVFRDGGGKLETHYIGAPHAPLRIRIYNKAVEQGVKGHWWRIEAQLRGDWCKAINGTLNQNGITLPPSMPDFFEGVKLRIPDISHAKNINEMKKY